MGILSLLSGAAPQLCHQPRAPDGIALPYGKNGQALFGKRGTLECLRRTLRPIILGCQVKSERIGDIQSYYSIICLNDPTYKIDC